MLTLAPRSELAQRRWRGRMAALDSPLQLQAPPYVFVSRRYEPPAPDVLALRELALSATRRLFG